MTTPMIKGISLPEELIVYCARVSNPENQLNTETGHKLLNYCLKHGHWSVFEQVNVCFEVTTSLSIGRQGLRHRSFTFQEFSGRYSEFGQESEPIELRIKGSTNRQGSTDMLASKELHNEVDGFIQSAQNMYSKLIAAGVAPECARFVLPSSTTTTMYMNGSVRSWLTYFMQRLDKHAQKEHRELAKIIFKQFKVFFPICSKLIEEQYQTQ